MRACVEQPACFGSDIDAGTSERDVSCCRSVGPRGSERPEQESKAV